MNLKKIKLDKSGKSNAIFFDKRTNIFDKRIITYLKNHYKKNKTELRFCLHFDKFTNLQVMINLIIRKKKYQLHFHKFSDEYYVPLVGNLKLLNFSTKGTFKSAIEIDKKNNFIGKIFKKETHVAIPIKKFCIYLEFRSGNFIKHKNKFLKKFIDYNKALKLK